MTYTGFRSNEGFSALLYLLDGYETSLHIWSIQHLNIKENTREGRVFNNDLEKKIRKKKYREKNKLKILFKVRIFTILNILTFLGFLIDSYVSHMQIRNLPCNAFRISPYKEFWITTYNFWITTYKLQFHLFQFLSQYCTAPQMIPNRKWSLDHKWSPKWTPNHPWLQRIPIVHPKWSPEN